jgi:hypothetical protein
LTRLSGRASEAEVSRICTVGTAAVNPAKGAAFAKQAKPKVVARIAPAANPNFDLKRMFPSIELFFQG